VLGATAGGSDTTGAVRGVETMRVDDV